VLLDWKATTLNFWCEMFWSRGRIFTEMSVKDVCSSPAFIWILGVKGGPHDMGSGLLVCHFFTVTSLYSIMVN